MTVGLSAAVRAKNVVRAALAGHRVVSLLDMEIRGESLRVAGYNTFVSRWYRLTVLCVITGLMLLAFWEGHKSKSVVDATFSAVAVAEIAFVLLLAADCALDAFVNGVRRRSYADVDETQRLGFSGVEGSLRPCVER